MTKVFLERVCPILGLLCHGVDPLPSGGPEEHMEYPKQNFSEGDEQ
jgi:hypothetical protein